MATTMKAAILHGREDVRIEHVPVPEAGPGELIVAWARRSPAEPTSRFFAAAITRG